MIAVQRQEGGAKLSREAQSPALFSSRRGSMRCKAVRRSGEKYS